MTICFVYVDCSSWIILLQISTLRYGTVPIQSEYLSCKSFYNWYFSFKSNKYRYLQGTKGLYFSLSFNLIRTIRYVSNFSVFLYFVSWDFSILNLASLAICMCQLCLSVSDPWHFDRYGSGFSALYRWLTDPDAELDPDLFVSLKDANKKSGTFGRIRIQFETELKKLCKKEPWTRIRIRN